MHCASSAGNGRTVNILITSGALVNVPNAEGDFAIDVVGDAQVKFGCTVIIRFLFLISHKYLVFHLVESVSLVIFSHIFDDLFVRCDNSMHAYRLRAS